MIIEVKNDTMLGASIEKACLVKLQKENQELKKQQKEFIEWLEKMIKDLSKNEEYEIATTYEYILSKYKEIIGGKDE